MKETNSKRYLKFTIIVFFVLGLCTLNAQQKSITGKVKSKTGEPLPGATVIQKGTSNGVQTNLDGEYKIIANGDNLVLIFSYVGYLEKEVVVENQNIIDVVLDEDVANLDEVIVIGYGTQRKGNLSGAVSTLSDKVLEGRPATNFQNALQGQVAGLQITSNSGTPGGKNNIRIRGTGSITGGSSPLYVVDGNIISASIGGSGDPFSTINPSDIASINVLKDASAAAIYGARAANGVIIITTKRGRSGKPKINFNTYTGFQNVVKKLDLLNANQYQEVMNTVRDNSEISRIPNLDGTTLSTYTNWQDEVFRTAYNQNYELSVSGGGDKTRYYTSIAHNDEDGTIIGTGFTRTSLRINTDTELGNFKFGNSLTLSRSKYDREFRAQGRSILYWALANSPAIPIYNPDNVGGYNGPTDDDGDVGVLNPVAAQSLVDRESAVNRILGNVYAEYQFLKDLNYRVNVAVDLVSYRNSLFAPYFELTPGESVRGLPNGAQVNDERGESLSLILENTLSYKKKFGNHNIDLLVGYTVQNDENSKLNVSVSGGNISDEFPVVGASGELVSPPGGSFIEERTISYIGRAIYDYNNTYLATFNFRRDGSSLFSKGNYFDNFLSGSVGWVISNEKFMENASFSNLKLRASYGFLGNDQIDANATNSVLNTTARYILGNPSTIANAVAPSGQVANPNLVWEKQEQLNVGLDVGFLEGKLNFSLDYFEKNSEDLLLKFQLPDATGFDNIFLNAAEVQNKGFELAGNYQDSFGKLDVGFSFNLSTLKNEVVSLIDGLDAIERNRSNEFTYRNRIEPGNSLFAFYGYQVDGIYQSQAEIDNASVTPINGTAPGDFIFRDVSGPDGVPDGKIDQNDRTFIGDGNQDIQYGFTFNLAYEGFDLTAQFQGVAGNDIWNDTKFYTQSYFRTNNLTTDVLNAWTPSNTSTTQPRAVVNTKTNNDLPSSYFIEDGSYLRLKNLQIGYNFSSSIAEKIGLRKARIYLAGQNLLTITNYSGFDPEIGVTSADSNALGFDNIGYPQAKKFILGLKVGF